MEASPTAFLMWPSARPHESFMRQSLSTLLLLLLLLLLRRCLVGTAGSPFQDPFLLLLLLLHQIPPMLLGELSVSRICQSEPYSDRLRSYRSFLSFWSFSSYSLSSRILVKTWDTWLYYWTRDREIFRPSSSFTTGKGGGIQREEEIM